MQPDIQTLQYEHLILNPDIQALSDEHLRLHPDCQYHNYIIHKLPQIQQVFPFQHCRYKLVLYFLEESQWLLYYAYQ